MRRRRLLLGALVVLLALPIAGNVPPSLFHQMSQYRLPLGGFESAAYLSRWSGYPSPEYFLELPQLAGPGLRAFFGTYTNYSLINLGGGRLDAQSVASTVDTPGPGPGRGNLRAVFSPSGRSLFVTAFFANEISAFSVDPSTGDLSEAPGSPYTVGDAPTSLAVDPTGRFLYVGHSLFDPEIDAFSIDPNTSELTPLASYPLPSGVSGGLETRLTASRHSLYVAGDKAAIGEYLIQEDGTLAFDRYLDLNGNSPDKDLVVTPDGRFVYYSGKSCGDSGCGGGLPPQNPVIGGYITGPPGFGPFPTNVYRTSSDAVVAVHPTLPYLYAASSGVLQPLAYNEATGEIAENGPGITIDSGQGAVAVHPSGLALYVWSAGTGNLQSFAIDPSNGRPSAIGAPLHLENTGAGEALAVQFLPRDAMAGVGIPYSQTVALDGLAGPFDYSVTGNLPPGLTLDASTGVISGTPTGAGTFGFLIRATGRPEPERFVTERATTIQVLAATAAPTAPSGLVAEVKSSRSVSLTWSPGTGASDQRVEASLDGRPFGEWVNVAPPAAGSMLVEGLSPASAYAFRVKAGGSGGAATSNTVTVTTPAEPAQPCQPGTYVACMIGGRFQLDAIFQQRDGNTNSAKAFPITSDTSYLYFFNQDNVEVVAKVLDGCSSTNHYWVFVGGLTNVAVSLRFTDTQTGAFRDYGNPASTAFAPIQDTFAFGTCGAPSAVYDGPVDADAARLEASLAKIRAQVPALAPTSPQATRRASSATCTPDAETACLTGGRFQVRATYAASNGSSGAAQMVSLTGDTAYMWFFASSNVEAVVKVLDGCALSNTFWVFAGGLTNVEVTMTVTDTVTGAVQTYTNPQGTPFQPIQDTHAFVCP